MIDQSKNVCYLIEVPYDVTPKDSCFVKYKRQKFVSLHGHQTKEFEQFRNDYFKNILKVSIGRVGEWDDGGKIMAYQQTISRKAWESEDVRKRVTEGITELEKCR